MGRLAEDIRALSCVYNLVVDDNFDSLIVQNFNNMPPGYNFYSIKVLLELPKKYPQKPPGVGDSRVYVPDTLRFNNAIPSDFHAAVGPKNWAWWCYERIDWNPCKDNLITFFELLRAHMTNPSFEPLVAPSFFSNFRF